MVKKDVDVAVPTNSIVYTVLLQMWHLLDSFCSDPEPNDLPRSLGTLRPFFFRNDSDRTCRYVSRTRRGRGQDRCNAASVSNPARR